MIQFFERIIEEKDYLSCFKDTDWVCILSTNQQLNHPVAHDWLPTEAKQGWAWSGPGWETSWEN